MKVNLSGAHRNSQFKIVDISLNKNDLTQFCIRGSNCRGKDRVHGTGAPGEYFARLKPRTGEQGGFNTFYCGECLSHDIGWLRFEMVKLELSRES